MYGLEAGQSAVGDIFNWFVKYLTPGELHGQGRCRTRTSRSAAEQLKPGESGLLALDWNNGNRTILVDPLLTGLLVGQTLHTTAPEVYRALVEATAFGALTIINRFEEYGVAVKEVVNCGGIAEKNPFVMQIYADVTGADEDQPLGPDLRAGRGHLRRRGRPGLQDRRAGPAEDDRHEAWLYRPNKAAAEVYAELYSLYRTLHDAFGTSKFSGQLNQVMKDLIAIRQKARQG